MLDMSWGEVMLIGGVALIVIGPKDLPKALRTVGQITRKVRRMAGEFQMQFNEAIREAELDDVRKEVDGIRDTVRNASGGFNPVQTIRDEVEGRGRGPRAEAELRDAGRRDGAAEGSRRRGADLRRRFLRRAQAARKNRLPKCSPSPTCRPPPRRFPFRAPSTTRTVRSRMRRPRRTARPHPHRPQAIKR